MKIIDQFEGYVQAIDERSRTKKSTIAVVADRWNRYLDATLDAVARGWVNLRVIGSDSLREECAKRFSGHPTGCEYFTIPDPRKQIDQLRRWCAGGEIHAILQGDLSDSRVSRMFSSADPCATLEEGIARACILSIPTYPKPLTVIGPFGPEKTTFDTMVHQMKYGFHLMKGFNIDKPKVALLSAMDKVGIDDLHTYNCRCLISMVKLEQIPSLDLEGPLSIDTAVDPGTVEHLGWKGPVAGQADVIVVDSRQTRSVIALTLTEFGNAKAVRIILGGRLPVLILNEGSQPDDGINGIAVALSLSSYMKKAEPLDWLTHPEPIDYAW
jgi:phosphate acetyltransferase